MWKILFVIMKISHLPSCPHRLPSKGYRLFNDKCGGYEDAKTTKRGKFSCLRNYKDIKISENSRNRERYNELNNLWDVFQQRKQAKAKPGIWRGVEQELLMAFFF